MLSAEHLSTLRSAVGADALQCHPPLDLDGAAPEVTLAPADGEALGRALAALTQCGLAAWVRGGGARGCLGNTPARADVVLSCERLTGVEELDASDGVCCARSGTPLAELRAAVREGGWELPLDPPGAAATLGGALAAAASGPRVLGFGRPRDLVLGLSVVSATGEHTRCGGRVVKNVTGYDLNKLYVGSLGTLGVIESAWLRLRPRPERATVCEASLADRARACELGLAASRRVTARAVAVSRGVADSAWRLVVELAGDAPGVERDLAWLLAGGEFGEAPPETLDRVRDEQGADPLLGARFRLHVLGSRLEPALAALCEHQAELLAYPGTGLVFAHLALPEQPDESAAAARFGAVTAIAHEAGGHAFCEAAPSWSKRGRDVFGASGAELALMRALKERFDRQGVLNPGRFAGGL